MQNRGTLKLLFSVMKTVRKGLEQYSKSGGMQLFFIDVVYLEHLSFIVFVIHALYCNCTEKSLELQDVELQGLSLCSTEL